METPKMWSLQEVADYLQVPAQTVYVWRHKGTGPRGFKVGRWVRYRPAEVEAWLEAQADQPRKVS